MNRLLPWIVLVLGVALLQAHAWYWWADALTGAPPCFDAWACWAGWHALAWPLVLEALALWSWPQAGWRRRPSLPAGLRDDPQALAAQSLWRLPNGRALVAMMCTAILLATVLWRVSDPAVRALVAPAPAAQDTPAIVGARQAVEAEQALLDTFRADWRTRPEAPAQAQAVRAARARLEALLGARMAAELRARLDWRTGLGIVLQALAVIGLQVGVVLAVVHLFGGPREEKPWWKTPITGEDLAAAGARGAAAVGRPWMPPDMAQLSREAMEEIGAAARAMAESPAERRAGLHVVSPQPGAESPEPAQESGGGNGKGAPESALESEAAPPEPEPELTQRVQRAREALFRRLPGRKGAEVAAVVGVREADLSFLMNHEARAQKRSVDGKTRIISEAALARVEAFVAAQDPPGGGSAGTGRVKPV